MATNTPALPQINQQDLKDANLDKINRNFRTIWTKVVAIFGGAGAVTISAPLIAPDVQIPSQTSIPDNDASVLTKGAALQLFSPANLRQAFLSGAFQQTGTRVQQTQPLSGAGGGLSVTVVGTFTINGVAKTQLTFTAGILTDAQ